MTKTNIRRRKSATNWPLFALAGVATVAGEALVFALLWTAEPDHTVGLLYSALTCSFSLLGLVASRAAGLLKADPRRHVADKAFAARCVSVALLLPTVFIGGGAMAQRMEVRAANEYATGEEYQADLLHSKGKDENGNVLDSQAVNEATAKLARAVTPTQVRMDDPAYAGSIIAFLAMLLLPSLAAGNALTFAPETPAQEKARLRAASVAKAKATREKNARAALRAIPPAKRFNLLRNVS